MMPRSTRRLPARTRRRPRRPPRHRQRRRRRRPPPAGPSEHPDVAATNELVASLRTRAARVGITDLQFGAWLDSMNLPQEDNRLRLTVGERQRLSEAFNRAIDATKAQQAAAATDTKRPRARKTATGD